MCILGADMLFNSHHHQHHRVILVLLFVICTSNIPSTVCNELPSPPQLISLIQLSPSQLQLTFNISYNGINNDPDDDSMLTYNVYKIIVSTNTLSLISNQCWSQLNPSTIIIDNNSIRINSNNHLSTTPTICDSIVSTSGYSYSFALSVSNNVGESAYSYLSSNNIISLSTSSSLVEVSNSDSSSYSNDQYNSITYVAGTLALIILILLIILVILFHKYKDLKGNIQTNIQLTHIKHHHDQALTPNPIHC